MIFEEGKWGESYDCPSYCLEAFSRPQHRKVEPSRAWWSCQVEETEIGVQKTTFTGLNIIRERDVQRQSSKDQQRAPFKFLAENAREETKSQGWVYNHRKAVRQTIPWSHTGPGTVCVPTDQKKGFRIHKLLDRVLKKGNHLSGREKSVLN